VANALLQAARAVGLLGARVIICGITPETAQVVVNLGIDLSSITTCGDLQAALTLALRVSGYKVTR
jgi:rsbT co-antagonist protein RsbR